MRTVAILATLLLGVLAGCMSMTTYCLRPNLTAHAVGPDAPVSNGTGDITIPVLVTDAGTGQPIADAAIRAYWPVDPSAKGSSATWVVFFVFVEENEPTYAPALVYADLRTGPEGKATLTAPAGARVTAVATAGGYTMEFASEMAEPGAPTLEVPLHRSTLTVSREHTWTDVDVRLGYTAQDGSGDAPWNAEALPWTDDPAASRNYTIRMVQLEARLTWENLPGHGDLAIGFGKDAEEILAYANAKDDLVSFEAGNESMILTFNDLEGLETVGDDTLYAGSAYEALVAPLGLVTNLTLTGTFDSEFLANRYCTPEYSGVEDVMTADGAPAPEQVTAPPAPEEGPGPTQSPPPSTPPPNPEPVPETRGRPETQAKQSDSFPLVGLLFIVLGGACGMRAFKRREA